MSFRFRLKETGGETGSPGNEEVGQQAVFEAREGENWTWASAGASKADGGTVGVRCPQPQRDRKFFGPNELLFPFQEEKETRGRGVSTLGQV